MSENSNRAWLANILLHGGHFLIASYVAAHLFLTATLRGSYYYSPFLMYEETEDEPQNNYFRRLEGGPSQEKYKVQVPLLPSVCVANGGLAITVSSLEIKMQPPNASSDQIYVLLCHPFSDH